MRRKADLLKVIVRMRMERTGDSYSEAYKRVKEDLESRSKKELPVPTDLPSDDEGNGNQS